MLEGSEMYNEIQTQRLILRPFNLADSKRVQMLAGAKEISDTTGNVPHPYPDGAAEAWISTHAELFESGTAFINAIVSKDICEVVGVVAVRGLNTEEPELGYWVGKEYWNKGYCTEACSEIIPYCSSEFGISEIYGRHLVRNPSSGKVMEKCGLKRIGTERKKIGFMTCEEEFFVYKGACI